MQNDEKDLARVVSPCFTAHGDLPRPASSLFEQVQQLRNAVMLAVLNIDLERNGLTPDGNVRERLVKVLEQTQ